MPKARATANITHPKTGEPIAAGAEVDLDDEEYAALRSTGALEASEEEQRAGQTEESQGNYGARTARSDVAGSEGVPAEPAREESFALGEPVESQPQPGQPTEEPPKESEPA